MKQYIKFIRTRVIDNHPLLPLSSSPRNLAKVHAALMTKQAAARSTRVLQTLANTRRPYTIEQKAQSHASILAPPPCRSQFQIKRAGRRSVSTLLHQQALTSNCTNATQAVASSTVSKNALIPASSKCLHHHERSLRTLCCEPSQLLRQSSRIPYLALQQTSACTHCLSSYRERHSAL